MSRFASVQVFLNVKLGKEDEKENSVRSNEISKRCWIVAVIANQELTAVDKNTNKLNHL